MKSLVQLCCYIILVLGTNNALSQNISIIEINNSIEFGNRERDLGKGLQFEKASPMLYTPDDIEIDINNNFYICDRFSKRIIKYDSLLNYLYEIKIEDENFQGNFIYREGRKALVELFFQVYLETDMAGNLFVLISKQSYYYRLMKYNKSGQAVIDFNLDVLPRNMRVDGLKCSKDKLFIYSFEEFNLDTPDYHKSSTFIYNLEGNLLGRSDAYVEDYKGRKYKKGTEATAILINQYLPVKDGKISHSSELIVNKSISANNPQSRNLMFIDFDSNNNLYFMEVYPFGLQIINFDSDEKKEIYWETSLQKYIKSNYKILIPNIRQFIISSGGEIYTYGFCTKNKDENLYDKFNYGELELKFLQIKILEK